VIELLDDRSGPSALAARRLRPSGRAYLDAPGDRWPTEGAKAGSLSVLVGPMADLDAGPPPAGGGGSRITSPRPRWAAWAARPRRSQVLVAAAKRRRGRGDGPGPAGWGCRCRRSVRPSPAGGGLLGPGETGAGGQCWRGRSRWGFQAGAAAAKDCHRFWLAQPATGLEFDRRTVAAIEERLIEPATGK